MEDKSIKKLQELIDQGYKIEKIYPPFFGSDAEVNIVTITLISSDGKKENIKAFREESHQLREYIRKNRLARSIN